jgi:hypothetical protein
MDKKKAKEFIEELNKLQEKFGLHISSTYVEEIDYNYEEEPYVSGVSSHLVLVDGEGFEVSLDDLLSGFSTCYYCGRNIEIDSNFCNMNCEKKYKDSKTR